MKWTKENKELVYQLLRDKSCHWRHELLYRDNSRPPGFRTRVAYENLDAWNQFLDSLGIERVARGSCESGRYRLGSWWLCSPYSTWPVRDHSPPTPRTPARSKKHIIIPDPFLDHLMDRGLRIPKDVAEKFLVLGVP